VTILFVETWVVKPEKQAEFTKWWQKNLKYMKQNPKMFKEMKSMKVYTQRFGGVYGAYVVLAEFDSLADFEKLQVRTMKDEGLMKMYQESILLIDPTTYTVNIWNALE